MRAFHCLPLLAFVVATAVHAADAPRKAAAPKPPALKEGWTEASVERFSEECTLAVMTMMRRDFDAAAARAGDTMTQFPEMAAGPAFRGMCFCIGRRVGTSYTSAQWEANQSQYGNAMLKEALSGGQCKPEGLLGHVMERSPKEPPPKSPPSK